MAVTTEQLRERGLQKLKSRRVSSGWWIGIYDSLPEFLLEIIKPFHRLSAWQIFYVLSMSFFLGVASTFILDLFHIWISSSRTIQDELSVLNFSWLALGGALTVSLHVFIALAHPANSGSMFLISQYIKIHPEMAPIIAKWASKRGFFTKLDIHRVEQACRIIEMDPNTATRWALMTPIYRVWNLRMEKLKNKKERCKNERADALINSGLMPYIEAASMDKKTIPASATSTARQRL